MSLSFLTVAILFVSACSSTTAICHIFGEIIIM